MPTPTPSTWSLREVIKAPQLRHDVSDAVSYLATRPIFAGQTNQGQTITTGSDETFGLYIEIYDTWNGHQNPGAAYYCQSQGWYLCQCAIPFAYTGTTQYVFAAGFQGQAGGAGYGPIRGALQVMGSGRDPMPQAVDLILMTEIGAVGGAGDYIEMVALQATGSDQTLQTILTKLPYVSLRWVAAPTGTAPLAVPANPSWPSTYLTSSFLNTNIRDVIRFLTYPPIYRVHGTGAATLPSQNFPAGTNVPFATIDVDNYSGGTTGASASYTAPVAGVYFCYGQINLAGTTSTSNTNSAGFSVNGGTTQWGDVVYQHTSSAATGAGMLARKRLRLNAGDTVQLIGQQSSGGALGYNGTAENETRMIVVWESA